MLEPLTGKGSKSGDMIHEKGEINSYALVGNVPPEAANRSYPIRYNSPCTGRKMSEVFAELNPPVGLERSYWLPTGHVGLSA